MKKMSVLLAAIMASLAAMQPGLAQQGKPGIERLYVLYCGDIALNDASSFTPGASGPGALSVTCYIIKHAQGWLLWDTGLPDAIVTMPDGQKSPAGVWTSKKTLVSQLAELSHSHLDHVGNLGLFPQATLVVQKAEYDWVPPVGGPPFKPEQQAIKAEGDHDLFGDGSVILISTPGHTPGHQCLLVKLPRTGALLLSGDAVHTKANWDSHRVPQRNLNVPQSLASLDRMTAVLKENNGQL